MGRRQPSLERLGQLADLLELDLGDLDDALELAGAFPLRRGRSEVGLSPRRIAEALLGPGESVPRRFLVALLEQVFALAGHLRERADQAAPGRAKPSLPSRGISRMATLADALRILRASRRVTQSRIAKALAVPPSIVSAWERGQRRPSLERFGQLADALQLDLGELDDALERTGTPFHRDLRRRRRPRAEVDLEPARLAARLLGRLPGDPGDSTQDQLRRLLEDLFGLVGTAAGY